jgi:hypothetical protein
LLIGFSSKEDNARFKRLAVEKLGADYDIHEMKGILPRIKVVGMTQIYRCPKNGVQTTYYLFEDV